MSFLRTSRYGSLIPLAIVVVTVLGIHAARAQLDVLPPGRGGGGSGSGISQADADLRYLQLSGGTLTGGLSGTTGSFSGAVSGTTGTFSSTVSGVAGTFSGAVSGTTGTFSSTVSGTTGTFTNGVAITGTTLDITTTGNEDLRLAPAGTGRTRLRGGDNIVAFENAAGTQAGFVEMASGASPLTHRILFNGGALGFSSNGSGGVGIGANGDNTAAQKSGCFSENISGVATRNDLICAYGGGRLGFELPQTCTCVSNAGAGGTLGGVTCDPTSAVVLVTNPDADGCIVTLSETSAAASSYKTTFIVTSNTGGVITFPDVANVHAGPACADTTGLGVGDTYETIYVTTTLGAYQGIGCGDN